ncbi:glycosyltransferase [Brevundimonas sp. NIBR11]|uniref:glycosyltransferase n=1 Tax=Brevundimonas sp. NIBR11 TaxID=3015999 RepID=UPI0022F0382F|nr:glycosyltransferase [Brevundimonas sp. NIBR11]WGM32277.1 hypothetical protein KKHFBJBL_02528 [Brevundimonas sp. NIBR11]
MTMRSPLIRLTVVGEQIPPSAITPVRAPVKDRDIETTTAWLADLAQASHLKLDANWGDLVLTILTSHDILALIGAPADMDDAVARLSAHRTQAEEAEAEIAKILTFDADWFGTTPAGARFGPRADFATVLPRKADLPAALAWFTENLDILQRRERPETLGALVRATQKAGLRGELSHWLFKPAFYQEQAARSETLRDAIDEDLELDPYLAFLAHGDAADVSPHPLFSPFAYRKLNPGVEIGPRGCFHHFITEGAAAGLRTSALFDDAFYLSRQPQVRQDLAAGRYSCALEHFIRVGMNAGYAFSPDFDRHYYLSTNPDLAEALANGAIPSAEWHYVESGAREGRSPNRFFNAGYYAQRYPHIRDDMDRYGLNSTLEHFLLLGRERGWRVNRPPVSQDVDMDQAKALFEKRGRRAYADALSGVFAFDEAPVAPALSVIVPISGQADFTAGFLKSARWAVDHLQLKRGMETEIIIVDNGSRDHTARLLDALPGVRRVEFDRPIGFPAAVNAGVAASTGRIILVANNDIEFDADAFLRMVDALDHNPDLGVVGAKVVLPNETLQEVGSVLDQNGGSLGFGRGLDATDCRGVRTIEVDYASGCFVGFTRADYDALSGFDEAYSPGYYEEVDFSLRMKRDLGKPTVVDTGLAVTHYEHASFAKGRPQTVNEPLILRNRDRLRQEHAPLFAALRNRSQADAVRQAQKAVSGHARVLVVEDMVPTGLLGSGFGREEEILDIFTRLGIAYDIVALNPSPRIDEFKDPLARLYRGWMPGESLEDVLQAHPARYSHIWLCRTHNLGRATAQIQHARQQFGLQVICDTEALSSLRLVEQMAVQGRAQASDEVRALTAIELMAPIEVDLWIAVNRRERDLIEGLGIGAVQEIGHAVTVGPDADADAGFAERSRILFIGAVHELSSPNYDGLEWFLSVIYPRLDPTTRPPLTIAGFWAKGLPEVLKARFADLAIDFVGSVSDAELARLYAESRIAIAPTRFAAGIPCKVIEAVLSGVPIVMTDLLATQLEVADVDGLSKADRFDNGRSFARWVETLYTDEKAWDRQRELQTEHIGKRWSPERLEAQVVATVDFLGMRAGDSSAHGGPTVSVTPSTAILPKRVASKRRR